MTDRLRRKVGIYAVVLACAVAAALGGGAAHAVGFANVPCSGSGGGGAGLVAAVASANAAGGVINLASGCTYSITSGTTVPGLGTTGLPVITTAITINGNGATIAGSSSNFRIITIDGSAGGSLRVNGLTVTGGNVSGGGPAGFGGGILNLGGTLVLNNSTVTGNQASGAGGGIASATMGPGPGATLILNNSRVTSNTVPSSGMGGGGILSVAGVLTLNNSTVSDNTASGGGGIAAGNGNGGGPGSVTTINNGVISGNSATGGEETGGGGISNGGTLLMNNTRLTDNDADGGTGGGLLNHATATLNNVALTGNKAAIGAGIGNINLQGVPIPGVTSPTPTLTMNNGSVTGNTAAVSGGGIANISPFGAALGSVTLRNTQVNGNTPNNCIPVGSISGCSDTVHVFTASLSGANETPANGSAGTGNTVVTWDTATSQMTVNVTFSGLTGTTTASHIHCCAAPPANAPVATQVPSFTGFPSGVTSGSYSHTFDMTDPTSYNPAFLAANGGSTAAAAAALLTGIENGTAYLNIHTTAYPGGEIRGVLQEL